MSAQARIEHVPIDSETVHPDYKRCYVPGYVIKDVCPKCGTVAEDDLGTDYLSYPDLNKPMDHGMYCRNEECGGEWTVKIVLRMSVELAPKEDK